MRKLYRGACSFTITVCLFAVVAGCGASPVGTGPLATDSGAGPGVAQAAWPAALPADRVQPWERLDAAGRVIPQHGASSINGASEFVPGVERYLEGGDAHTDANCLCLVGAGDHAAIIVR